MNNLINNNDLPLNLNNNNILSTNNNPQHINNNNILENQQLFNNSSNTIQPVNFVNLNVESSSIFQQRSNSVIVNPPNNLINQEKINKRKRNNNNQQQQDIQLKIPKINNNNFLLKNPNEILGVNRFISPFSDEAKIPLPHELNELSTHGTTVWKRNERERQRVREVNKGYTKLKNTLPLTENDRRLSKVDTLRLAIAYIHHLEILISDGQSHLIDCQCFNYVMGECSSAENTPPPQN